MLELLSAIPSAIVGTIGAILIRKKSREDTHLSALGQAVITWQNLAESNKKHWETCEAATDKLETEIERQKVQIDDQRDSIYQLKLHIFRLEREINELGTPETGK